MRMPILKNLAILQGSSGLQAKPLMFVLHKKMCALKDLFSL